MVRIAKYTLVVIGSVFFVVYNDLSKTDGQGNKRTIFFNLSF